MGGEITWVCQGGGDYVFTLKIYRDCSGPPVNTSSQVIRVWNHPTITQIPVSYVATNEVSPSCTQVTGGPAQISCASNTVQGAAEEYIFTSTPINISGTPPAQGWAFTWDNLTRNASVINLVSPSTNGITLRAIMYSNGANGSPCYDSSPQFIELPSSITCAGNEFIYNPNAYDPDADSMVFSFGQPLNSINTAYTPPTDPAPLNWASGYSINSPLPSTTQNSGNIPATINSQTGEISFRSNTIGSFALVVRAQSYRCGILLAEVYREMQVIIVSCGTNSPPTITPPLNGNTNFTDTVTAGDLVSFIINANDFELLQDNTNQNVELFASGSQFGTNFTNSTSGCSTPPCATLSATPPIIGNQTVSTNFQWQTDCSHIKKDSLPSCNSSNNNTYNFVFKVKDDFCPAPATRYYTASITVLPPASLPSPDITCVSVLPNGEVQISWEAVSDIDNIFQSYEIYSSTAGAPFSLAGSINNIATTSFTHTGIDANASRYDYIIATKSACDILNFSDTVSSIKLQVNNPNNGEAILQWNKIFSPTNSPLSVNQYDIYREFPANVWTYIATVPYGNEYYRDTISFCSDSASYRVTIGSKGCTSVSSIDGDNFQDLLPPKPPVIKDVSVDTSSGFAKVCWNPSPNGDTRGYIILKLIGTTWQPIDSVYVGGELCYVDSSSTPGFNPECYGVAAFDSCLYGNPLSPNTSAMGISHCSMHLTQQYDVCNESISINWTDYTDWSTGVNKYNIYYSLNGNTVLATSTTSTSFSFANISPNSNYCFIIEAISGNNIDTAISNVVCVFTDYPQISDTNYLQVATVETLNKIRLKIFTSASSSIQGYIIQKSENGSTFNNIGFAPYSASPIIFDDNDVYTDSKKYYYRAIAIDSCGKTSDSITNIGKPILLKTSSKSNAFVIKLNWDDYARWDGGVSYYDIYRKEGTSPYNLIGSVPFGVNEYQDDVSDFYDKNTQGQFCYKIKAIENINSYMFSEESFSNESCANIDYILYVPNAFTPGGINPIFKPVIGFANFDSYSLTIYSRIYNDVFSTTDINEGWDGTYKGKPLPEGVFVYFIQFRDSKGQPFQKVGHVTLVK